MTQPEALLEAAKAVVTGWRDAPFKIGGPIANLAFAVLQAQGALQAAPESNRERFEAWWRALPENVKRLTLPDSLAWNAWVAAAAPQAAIGATPEPPTLDDVLDALNVFNPGEIIGPDQREKWTEDDFISVKSLPEFIHRVGRAWYLAGPDSIGVPSDSPPSGDLTESDSKSPEALGKRRCPCCGGTQPIGLPLGAKPLALQMQHGRPTLWALLDDEAEKQNLVVYCCGTGNPVLGNVGAYLGTVQDGHFVWHYFLQSRAT